MQEERALLLAYGASVPEYSPLQGGHIQCEEQRLLLGCTWSKTAAAPSGRRRLRLFLDRKPMSLAPSAYRG